MNDVPSGRQWPDLGFGVALKTRHYHQFLRERPQVDWLEVHTENYIGRGGFDLHTLLTLRRDYPFSLHGVGLGLGSAQGFSEHHLARFADLVRRIEPALVSDHLCWGALQDRSLNDLLPLGFNAKSLQILSEHIDRAQQVMGRQMLIENVSAYLRFQDDSWSEAEFLAELVKRTGCGVLLDVNNLYVNQCNHGEDPYAAIAALPVGCVGEIHLAGHTRLEDIVIDDHGSEVIPEVWDIYRAAIARFGRVATMVEWDTNVPELSVLLGQAQLAREHTNTVIPLAPGIEMPVVREGKQVDVALLQQNFGAALFDLDRLDGVLPFCRSPADIVTRRFRFYRGNLRGNWAAAMGNAYPILKKLVGDEFFTGLVNEYGQRYPSSDANLNVFGAQFDEFLRDFKHVVQYPYFPDVARLEWAMHMAYYEIDVEAVSMQQVAALAPEELDASRFDLNPVCRLLSLQYDAAGIWQAHQHDPVLDFPDPLQRDNHVLIVRPQWLAQPLTVSHAAYTALSLIQQGSALGDALDAALEVDEEFPFIEQLQLWLQQKVLVHCQS
ncbi:MAG: DUF692 family protein [Burkholderiales bacterium]|nr:DUF692 family protein [Burkholderiales bacterium]